MKYIVGLLPLMLFIIACSRSNDAVRVDELPPIYPDYTDVTIPVNIAPLNFLLRNEPDNIEVSLKGESGGLVVRSSSKIQFPLRRWHSLLQAEAGKSITVRVKAEVNGEWIEYAPFKWQVTADEIDPYLSYRLIEPGYEVWNRIQIAERNVENFEERVLADNNLTDRACMNCHIYSKQNPSVSLLHLRGAKGGTILNREGTLRKLNTKVNDKVGAAVYGEVHPSGRYGVFSSNVIVPAFHTYGSERLEVYDTESEVYLLDFDTNEVIPMPVLGEKETFRTFPVFAADGRSVYYCDAPKVALPDSIEHLMYSVHRIAFDPEKRLFGATVDTLFNATVTGKSVCHLKASPDGKYLLYTVADYGTFPIWHREADLQMLHLQTGVTDSLEIVNAPCSDTYHSWSSNSRWFVFASKRDDGIYGKPYFAYIDNEGKAHKPFVLPQRDPARYDYTLKSFNIPELSQGQVPFDAMAIEAIYHNSEAEPFTFGGK